MINSQNILPGNRSKKWVIACILLFSIDIVQGQDLEKIGEQKAVTVGGGISWNNTFYTATGMENRRDPYFWQFNANLNFNFFGVVQTPFSLTISQQQKNFNQPQPFNRFGLSPNYKSITAHLGHRSMSFSQFTLAGTIFLGTGAEYKPKNNPWRASAMYGQLAKPVNKVASDGLVFTQPTYRRIGYGAKIGYEKDDFSTHLIMFRAEDDENSISVTDSLEIRPEENLVLGLVSRFKVIESLTFEIDYAYSLFSRDVTAPKSVLNEYSFKNNLGGLYNFNSSSTFTNALQSKFIYSGDFYQLNASYRRIDPDFITLGSSFLNNDLEDISGGVALPLLDNKVSLSANAGVQKNNLNNQLAAEIKRFIFSSSASIRFSERLNSSFSYSNFNSNTSQMLLQRDVLSDTLEFFQVTRSGTVNATYQLGKENQNSVFTTFSLQDATDSDKNQSTFTNINAGYTTILNQIWRITLSGSYNRNETLENETSSYGPVLGVGRSLANNKIQTNLSVNLFNSYQNDQLQSRVSNIRWSANSSIGKHQSVSLNAFYIIRRTEVSELAEATGITELRGNVNYAYRF
ncbi:MAG: hypothetical protein GY816_13845 [Cytophagales bacterium]|nr:hypothetical protein [Cytophagales bacterium]